MHKYAALMDEIVADAAKVAMHKAEHIMKDADAEGPDHDELKDLTNCIYILNTTDEIMSRHYPDQVEHTDTSNSNGTATKALSGVANKV